MSEVRPNKAGIFPKVLDGITPGTFAFVSVALGNMTQYKILVAVSSHGVVIGIENVGMYEFGGFAHQGYVQDKLGLKFAGDAANVADFINDQLNNNSKRQGEYSPHLCRD